MTDESTPSFERARTFYRPYLIARPPIAAQLNHQPMGLGVPDEQLFDPLALKSAPFIRLVHRLHSLVCGPFGMPMESWVQYDCSLMPGLTFGFAHPAEGLPHAIRIGLGVEDDYTGLVPFSVGIGIPLPDRETWEIYSLGSLNLVAPGAGPAGLNRLTLAFGTAALGLGEALAILRWRSHLLGVFAGLGPLRLITAWTPAHDYPDTVTVSVQVNDRGRQRLLRGVEVVEEKVDEFIDADDSDVMQDLQRRIEGGEKIYIVGPPRDLGTQLLLPITASSRIPTDAVRIDTTREQGGLT